MAKGKVAGSDQGNSGGTPQVPVNNNPGVFPKQGAPVAPQNTTPTHGPLRKKPAAGLGTPMSTEPTTCP